MNNHTNQLSNKLEQLKYKSNYTNNINNTNFNNNTTINIVYSEQEDENYSNLDYFLNNIALSENLEENIFRTLPPFLKEPDYIFVPSKIKRNLEEFYSIKELKKINSDVELAREKCLLFMSLLVNAFGLEDESDWHSLSYNFLINMFSDKYIEIINVLKKGIINKKGEKEPAIEIDNSYIVGVKCKKYKLAPAYLNKGINKYKFKNNDIIGERRNEYYKLLDDAFEHIISKNLMKVYQHIKCPSIEEIKKQAKKLIKEKYTTKKQKKLVFKNKHKKERWNDLSEYSFVEENIEIYERLVDNGYRVPLKTKRLNGGRIVDSFTLMSSWIRKMITMNNEKMTEVDYIAFHPNLAIYLYGGESKYLTHQFIADELEIDDKIVKKEHLSFFNKRCNSMYFSKLFKFYEIEEPIMLEKIMNDKSFNQLDNEQKHKITTIRMFNAEVLIMEEVIYRLNQLGIYVIYIYDALQCKISDSNKVKEVMDQVVLEAGIYTTAK